MRTTVMLASCCLWLGVVGLVAGCSSHNEPGPDHPVHGVNPDGTPKWVKRGSGAYDGEAGKAFYGVGVVTGIQNISLSRQTASNRARGEVNSGPDRGVIHAE